MSPLDAPTLGPDFRLLADCSPAMMWRSGADGSCDWFNKSWLDFTRRTLTQELGRGWVEGIHPDDRAAFLEIFDAALAQRSDFSAIFRLRRHDGAYRWILGNGRPVCAEDGPFCGLLGSCTDLTEQKEAEGKLLEALSEQELLLEEIRHRVRNNMQVIVGFVNLLNRQFGNTIKPDLDQMAVRIQALARMQQYFYATPERAHHVELAHFLQNFADDFARDAQFPIHVEVAGTDVMVDIGKATSIGLAVTEALLSCADPDRPGSDIRIGLQHSTAQLLVSIEKLQSLDSEVTAGEATLHLLELYARLMAGAIEITRSEHSTKIVLTMAA